MYHKRAFVDGAGRVWASIAVWRCAKQTGATPTVTALTICFNPRSNTGNLYLIHRITSYTKIYYFFRVSTMTFIFVRGTPLHRFAFVGVGTRSPLVVERSARLRYRLTVVRPSSKLRWAHYLNALHREAISLNYFNNPEGAFRELLMRSLPKTRIAIRFYMSLDGSTHHRSWTSAGPEELPIRCHLWNIRSQV